MITRKQHFKCNTTCVIEDDTYFIQVLMSTKTRLCRRERQNVPYIRAAPHGRPLQLPLFLHKDWYSALHASISHPLVHPFSKRTSKGLLNTWKGENLPPLTTIAGQKQLLRQPMSDFEATVDSKQFTNSSRKRRASRWNSVHKHWFPILSSAVITRVSETKVFSSVARNRE